jgi:hypothetical protein
MKSSMPADDVEQLHLGIERRRNARNSRLIDLDHCAPRKAWFIGTRGPVRGSMVLSLNSPWRRRCRRTITMSSWR